MMFDPPLLTLTPTNVAFFVAAVAEVALAEEAMSLPRGWT